MKDSYKLTDFELLIDCLLLKIQTYKTTKTVRLFLKQFAPNIAYKPKPSAKGRWSAYSPIFPMPKETYVTHILKMDKHPFFTFNCSYLELIPFHRINLLLFRLAYILE